MSNNNKNIVKLFYFIAGNPNKYDLKHRIFNISCIASAFIGLTGTIVNIVLGLDITTTITTTFLFTFFMGMYFISKKYKKYKSLLPIYLIIILLIIVSLWFSNEGTKGPTAFAFILLVFVFNMITESKFRKLMNILIFLSLLSLLTIEYKYPNLIQKYTDPNIRFFDYSFTVLFEMLVMILISSYFVKSFYEDKNLTEQQRDEIQEKNEEITITQQELLKHKENLEELVKKRTIELEKEKIKAENSDKLKTAFLSNMSHEIRTPINAIIGFSKLLNSKNIDEQKKEEYLNIIIDKGHLLLNLINDVLDIAKIEANEINIKQEACNINEIIKEIHESFVDTLNKKELKFTIIEPTETTIIESDAARIKQILLNLVSNAFKFTEKGEIKIGFTLEKKDNKEIVKIFVSDTGIGIPKEKTNIIFDRFRQIDESNTKDFGGTGLGLAISKNLANLLGGDLFVISDLDKGSTFYFTIPCKTCKKTSSNTNSISETKKYNWKNKKILIAEDEEFNFIILHDLLKETEINITRAENGQEVLDILEKDSNFDLILLDIQMPKISGYDLFKIIRPKYPNIPIFAQTAYVMQEDIEKMNKIGFDEVITKPIDFENILNSIDKAIKANK